VLETLIFAVKRS